MQHPSVNPSLAPFGFVFPFQRARLEYVPQFVRGINRERIMGRLWGKCNRLKAEHPLPVQVIIHEILPSQARVNKITKGDLMFEGLPYLSRDILVLSSMVQWLATNVGDCFLTTKKMAGEEARNHEREFVLKLAAEMEGCDLVARIFHVCNTQCNSNVGRIFAFDHPHAYDSSSVSSRDRALVDGLMRWLGKRSGRSFVKRYCAIRDREYRNIRNKLMKQAG